MAEADSPFPALLHGPAEVKEIPGEECQRGEVDALCERARRAQEFGLRAVEASRQLRAAIRAGKHAMARF